MLLHLTAEATRRKQISVLASSRDLEAATKTARRAIQRAIDGLTTRGLIAVRQGTATKAAAYIVRILELLPMSGAPKTPPAQPEDEQVALFGTKGGAFRTPPPHENAADPEAEPVDIEGFNSTTSTLDPRLKKIFQRRPEQFSPAALDQARRGLHGHMRKFGIEANAHPPDDKITARFLACGEDAGGWPRLQALLTDLMNERKRPRTYGWFVTVALQRIHGIKPAEVKNQQAALKLVRSRAANAGNGDAADTAGLPEMESLLATLKQLEERKRLV